MRPYLLGFRRFGSGKAGVLQPVENLVRIHVITTRHLRNRDTANPRLRADHRFLVVAPVPTLPVRLPHTRP